MKIGLESITPDPRQLVSGTANAGLFSAGGIVQFKGIIDNIRSLIAEAKELQNPTAKNPSASDTSANPAAGLTKDQLMKVVKQFLDNLIKQGYGDKTVSKTLEDIPLTIKQIRSLI